MNINQLKYVVEIAKTGSITQAAINLYMNQPNLSKAVKELEDDIGIVIFKRTSKGMALTKNGEEFLRHAKDVLPHFEQMEALYKPNQGIRQYFDISVPRASYITYALTSFVNTISDFSNIEINFQETNSMQTIHNIIERRNNLGIIRFQTIYEKYFYKMLKESDIRSELVLDFKDMAVMSSSNPLAAKESLSLQDLSDMIEIVHGDLGIPSLSSGQIKKNSKESFFKRIYVYERGSQFDLLTQVPSTYMWVSPIPDAVLIRNDLVQKNCGEVNKRYRDVLIYPKEYVFNKTDHAFLEKLYQVRDIIAALQ
jgi:DNA-binding transcriptional LysR family regulator